MRVFVACLIAVGLISSPAMARSGAGGAADKPASGTASNAPDPANSSDQPAAAPKAATAAQPAESTMESELGQLRDLLEMQAKQLQEQSDQLKQQQLKMQQLEQQLAVASPRESLAGATPTTVAAAVSAPGTASLASPDPSAVITNSASASTAAPAPAQAGANPDEPMSIRYKGITLTPGGFMAAETVWRQKALASDVNTPFNSVPFEGSSNSHVSEFQASGRQSRIAMLMQGTLKDVKIGGYYEGDFLSAGATSNNNQSNSYTFRQRQFWGQAAFNSGFTVTGGQMWSLITETGHGLDNRTEQLPQTIDAQYHVGFSWARQYGVRFVQDFGNKFWLGFSVEESQATLTVHGNPTAQATTGGTPGGTACANAACTTTFAVPNSNPVFNNFLLGAFGTGGGLYNVLANYAYNPSPDLVVKMAWEPGFGHYELFGVFSEFRDRVFPCVPLTGTTAPAGCASITAGTGATNDSRAGGGIGANARWALFAKKVDLGFHFFGGDGIGRYGSAGLADTTARPDGTLAPIHNFQTLGTLQFHPTPKLDINLNAGVEYEARAEYIKSGTAFNEGYGYPTLNNSGCWTETLPVTGPATNTNLGVPSGVGGSTGFIPGPLANCTGDTRNLIEGTIGFWYRFYRGSRGTMQFGAQYSYYVRNTWRGVGTTSGVGVTGQPTGIENMAFTSLRYYLP